MVQFKKLQFVCFVRQFKKYIFQWLSVLFENKQVHFMHSLPLGLYVLIVIIFLGINRVATKNIIYYNASLFLLQHPLFWYVRQTFLIVSLDEQVSKCPPLRRPAVKTQIILPNLQLYLPTKDVNKLLLIKTFSLNII